MPQPYSKPFDLDPAVLGQMMTAENFIPVLPTKQKIGEFASGVIEKIPGVSACRMCIGGILSPSRQSSELSCRYCRINFECPVTESLSKCALHEDTDFLPVALENTSYFWGFLFIEVADSDRLTPYHPFIRNFCNHIAIHLENRHQREILLLRHEELKKRHDGLEDLVRLRTRELAESEEKFSTAFRNAPLLMSISSLDEGIFLDVNDAFTEATGYSREVAMGSTSVELSWVSGEDRKQMIEILKAEGCVKNLEINVKCANGLQLFCLYSAEIIEFGGKKRLLSTAIDITTRKKTEEALRDSESLLNRSQEIANIGSFIWNIKDDTLTWSKNMYAIHGIDQENFAGNLSEISHQSIHPEDRDRIRMEIEKMVEARRVWSMEFRVVRPTGEERIIRSSGEFELDENDYPAKCFGVHHDITEQKHSEEALRESEERFRIAKEASLDSFLAFRAERNDQGRIVDFIFTDMNANAEKMLQLSNKHLIGKRMCEVLPINRDHGFFDKYKAVVETGSPLEEEFYLPDTHVPDAWCYHQVVKLGDGIAIFHRDITERKRSENELRESEAKFRMLCNAAPISIMLFNREGTVTFVNNWHIDVFAKGKLQKEFFLGKKIYELPEIVNAGIDLSIKKILEGEEIFLEEVHFPEFAAGHEGYQKIIGVPILNGVIPDGGLLFREDLSQQKYAEIERKKMESSLQQIQKMQSIGTLAGGIAHDFNNILFPIVGMSEMFLEDFPEGSPERQNAEEIFKAGKRGSDLVKQILAFSRQSEHKMMPTRVQNILKEVIKLSRSTMPTYIEIKQDVQQDCGMVLADPSQLHQIGMNIITNAYHAIEDDGGTISVVLKQKVIEQQESVDINIGPGAYVVLSISDTGHGMSEELIEKIFDPYFTTKEQGKGTGLGLAVVYGIVQEHGGDIKVYSEIGEGSTFDIYLPLMQKSINTESIPEGEEYQGGSERILLVDDEEAIAKLEKQILERMGYKVTSSFHSVEALEAFKASPSSFDLVVTDMSMPNIPGDKLAQEIKQIRPEIPIIICTGFSERIHEDNIKQLGIDGLLMKPIVKSELAKTVRKVLDEAKG